MSVVVYKYPESSGRWDASGSFELASQLQREQALDWVRDLSNLDLAYAIEEMIDPNAFTLHQRVSLLRVAAERLRNES